MYIDVAVRLIGCVTIAVGFAAAYLCGRDEGRWQEARRQRQEPPIYMEHEHGGDPDDPT